MSRFRRRRPLAVLALLALSTAAACGGGGGGSSATSKGDGRTGTTTSTTGSGAGSDTATDGSSGGASGSRKGSGAIDNAETAPLRLKGLEPNKHGAPLPGRYLYDVAGTESPVELVVRDLLDDQDADHFDRTGDLGQLHIEEEGSEARASLVRWTARGVRLDAEQRAQNTTTGLQQGPVCDYDPDLELQPGNLAMGATWDDESTCSATQGKVTVTRKRTLHGEVVSASTAQVGGQTVPTVRVRRVTDTTTTSDTQPPLLVTEHREVTIEWIVASGLAARIDGTVLDTVSGAPKPPRAYTWTLRSTTAAE